MIKYSILLIVVCLFTNLIKANDITPYRNVEIQDDGVVVTYDFFGGIYQQDELYLNAKYWKVPGFGLVDEKGKPALPFRWDSFAVPNDVDIEILECEYRDTTFTLAPARHPLFETDTIGYTLETVQPISLYTGFYPESIVFKGHISNYRGQDIQKILIYPIQYNVEENIVRSYSKIKYKIYFCDADNLVGESCSISQKETLMRNILLNKSEQSVAVLKDDTTNALDNNKDYLIISIPEYEDAIKEFAVWKNTLGFRTHVVLNDNWTKDSVKSIIRELYEKDDEGINLRYLLIVGDIDDVPSYEKTNNSYTEPINYVTDLYYGCMGGEYDREPDILRGRIPVSSKEETEIVLNKIMEYEKEPLQDSVFYETGLHCAFFQDNNLDSYADRRFSQTSEEVFSYMQYIGKLPNRVYFANRYVKPLYWNNGIYSFGEEIPSFLRKPTFLWDGDSIKIKQCINNGCFYILQRGHGGETCWGNPRFKNGNIASLMNGKKMPVVFSISCLTGKFDYSSDCFAECFLKKKDGGCVGIFAATEVSFSGYNDVLTEVMFDAIWPDSILRIKMNNGSDMREMNSEPVYELGQILDMGMNYLDDVCGDISSLYYSTYLYTREIFHCFGDPSMMLRTDAPKNFSPIIKRINGVISVDANVNNAVISFYTPSTNTVDSYQGRSIEYLTEEDNVVVSLNKHNYIPFVLNCNKKIYVQNETISGSHVYVGEQIFIGENVTNQKEIGEVVIQNANVKIKGGDVILYPGTYIDSSSEVIINQ